MRVAADRLVAARNELTQRSTYVPGHSASSRGGRATRASAQLRKPDSGERARDDSAAHLDNGADRHLTACHAFLSGVDSGLDQVVGRHAQTLRHPTTGAAAIPPWLPCGTERPAGSGAPSWSGTRRIR